MNSFAQRCRRLSPAGVCALWLGVGLGAGVREVRAGATPPTRAALPLAFEVNSNPAAGPGFRARGPGYTLFLTADGRATLRLAPVISGPRDAATLHLDLAAARPDAAGVAQDELAGRVNYFIGNDPAQWRRGVPTFAQVKFASVYPGVDLIYHGNEGRLDYDFIITPGANTDKIGLNFSGADNVKLAADGALQLKLSGGSVRWKHPVAWQDIGGRRVIVRCEYELADDSASGNETIVAGRVARRRRRETVRFRLGAYDHTQPLVIDPVLLYSTYLGGASSSGDSANAVATDAAGNVYFTGTESSGMFYFPAARDFRDAGGSAVFVTKLDSTGTNAMFTTFIGGSGNDSGQALALDGAGHIFIAGNASSGFPITNGFQTAFANGFLAELSADRARLFNGRSF